MNLHAIKAGTPSLKWEGISSQINNVAKFLGVGTHQTSSLHSLSNLKGPIQSTSLGSLYTRLGRTANVKKPSPSKSEQDLAFIRSLQSVVFGPSTSMDENHLRLLMILQRMQHTRGLLNYYLHPNPYDIGCLCQV